MRLANFHGGSELPHWRCTRDGWTRRIEAPILIINTFTSTEITSDFSSEVRVPVLVTSKLGIERGSCKVLAALPFL
jgi:hypothetical protein